MAFCNELYHVRYDLFVLSENDIRGGFMFNSLGMPELILILVLALIIFGPRKLPEVGRSLGKTLNEFRRATVSSFSEVTEVTDGIKEEVAEVTNGIKEEVKKDISTVKEVN